MVSSLVAAGAAGSVSACSSADPPLPTDTIQVASVAPPAISGGTLLVSQSHANLAVAADSDRDVVWLVNLSTQAVRSVALQAGDEPGRVVEDAAGHVHVALRRAGAVATIDLDSATVIDRTSVCSAPRGIAFDAVFGGLGGGAVHVACAGGELVSLPAAGGAAIRALRLDRDLRDVVVEGDTLLVTRLRTAEVLAVNAEGVIVNRQAPPSVDGTTSIPVDDPPGVDGTGDGMSIPGLLGGSFVPQVAWRAIPSPSGGIVLAHQLAATSTVVISQPGGYGNNGGGGTCDGTIVKTSVTNFGADGNPTSPGQPASTIIGASLPVDIAFDGTTYAVVSAGSDSVFFTQALQVDPGPGNIGCASGMQVPMPGGPGGSGVAASATGQPVSIALNAGNFVVQIREPAQIVVTDSSGNVSQTISLNAVSRFDTGHSLFSHNASATSFLACESCHAEGHDDGHVWLFDTTGMRRTQNISGGVLDTVPLHWDGSMTDVDDIMTNVFVQRMGGAPQGPRHVAAIGDWLNSIPRYPASPSGTQAQITHGQQIFESSEAGCLGCHSGKHFTNNKNEIVGTGAAGEAFQVPGLLGVAARAPYMHDGCAATLNDRFDPTQAACNGGESHGHTAQLSASDVNDLISYLETL